MATLSNADRTFIQTMTAIGTTESVLSDIFLDDLYTRSNGDLKITTGLMWEAIAADQAKLVSYANGLQREDLSDLFDHCLKMADRVWATVAAADQFRNVALRPAPQLYHSRPWTEYYGRPWGNNRRRWDF